MKSVIQSLTPARSQVSHWEESSLVRYAFEKRLRVPINTPLEVTTDSRILERLSLAYYSACVLVSQFRSKH